MKRNPLKRGYIDLSMEKGLSLENKSISILVKNSFLNCRKQCITGFQKQIFDSIVALRSNSFHDSLYNVLKPFGIVRG